MTAAELSNLPDADLLRLCTEAWAEDLQKHPSRRGTGKAWSALWDACLLSGRGWIWNDAYHWAKRERADLDAENRRTTARLTGRAEG